MLLTADVLTHDDLNTSLRILSKDLVTLSLTGADACSVLSRILRLGFIFCVISFLIQAFFTSCYHHISVVFNIVLFECFLCDIDLAFVITHFL